jgi:ATP-dependent RNA helicase RhlE
MNYKQATAVQEQVIPIITAGKDLIASAQTGTGKTSSVFIAYYQRINYIRKSLKRISMHW